MQNKQLRKKTYLFPPEMTSVIQRVRNVTVG